MPTSPILSRRFMSILSRILLAFMVLTLHSDTQAAGESPDQARDMIIGGAGIQVTLTRGKAIWFRASYTPTKDHSHFRLATQGDNDTCLKLYRDLGSARADEALASDDDSGAGANAQITFPFGYKGPLYVKLTACGRVRSGRVVLVAPRLLREPGKCDSGGCVLAVSLGEQPGDMEMLTLLRRVRDLLDSRPGGHILRDLYWDLSAELWDDVLHERQFRKALISQLSYFLPALRNVVGGDKVGGDMLITEDLIRQIEDLKALIYPRLTPETSVRFDHEFALFQARARVGVPIRDVLSDLGVLDAGVDEHWSETREHAVLFKLKSDIKGFAEPSGRVVFEDAALTSLLHHYRARGIAPVFRAFVKSASDLRQVYRVTLENGETAVQLLRELQSSLLVEYAEIDGKVSVLSDDVYFRFQYGLMPPTSVAGGIDAVTAWGQSTGSPSLLVAVVDTGVDYNHADLVGRVRRDLGYDYADEDPNPMDDHGHGTHVAGIIAASANNGFAISGVAPQVTIVPVRVLGTDGQGSFSSVASGIEAAARAGAKIINLSLGSADYSQVIEDALRFASEQGALIIAAAGNDGDEGVFYPARSKYVMAISAVNRKGKLASFSSYGEEVDLAAPGVDVVSAWKDGDICYASGTSMAAPHVAGVAALALSRRPSLTREQLDTLLTTTARDAGSAGYDIQFGWGIVDAAKVLRN